MPAKPLTAIAIKALKPDPSKRLEIPDGGCRGLLLCVHPSGRKSWIMRLRRSDGRIGKITLGNTDTLSLAAARQAAAEIHHKRAQGIDPFEERAARSAAHAQKNADTFGALARRFIDEHARPRLRGWRETARILGLQPIDQGYATIPDSLADRWGARPVTEIDRKAVLAVIDEARHGPIPGMRKQRRAPGSEARPRALFERLNKFFAWCQGRLIIDRNPCAGLPRPAPPASRDRVLDDGEIRRLLVCGRNPRQAL